MTALEKIIEHYKKQRDIEKQVINKKNKTQDGNIQEALTSSKSANKSYYYALDILKNKMGEKGKRYY